MRELAALPRVVLLCGRYEGIDERFLEANVDEEISLGDYVLSGELGAAVIIDAVARLQDGALNDAESAAQDSFEGDLGLLDCPHYSQPAQHPLGDVPDVLRSGNHAAIAAWRRQQSLLRTAERRPDLLDEQALDKADRKLLEQGRQARNQKASLAQGRLYRLSWPIPSTLVGARSTKTNVQHSPVTA